MTPAFQAGHDGFEPRSSLHRSVAQSGSALGSGPRGRGSKSRHSDHVVVEELVDSLARGASVPTTDVPVRVRPTTLLATMGKLVDPQGSELCAREGVPVRVRVVALSPT